MRTSQWTMTPDSPAASGVQDLFPAGHLAI
jgi:hypothetical protein